MRLKTWCQMIRKINKQTPKQLAITALQMQRGRDDETRLLPKPPDASLSDWCFLNTPISRDPTTRCLLNCYLTKDLQRNFLYSITKISTVNSTSEITECKTS